MSENEVETVKRPDDRVFFQLAAGGGVLIRENEDPVPSANDVRDRHRKKLPVWEAE